MMTFREYVALREVGTPTFSGAGQTSPWTTVRSPAPSGPASLHRPSGNMAATSAPPKAKKPAYGGNPSSKLTTNLSRQPGILGTGIGQPSGDAPNPYAQTTMTSKVPPRKSGLFGVGASAKSSNNSAGAQLNPTMRAM